MRRWATAVVWTVVGGVLAGASWFSAPGFGGAWTVCGLLLAVSVAALTGALAHAMSDLPDDVKEPDRGNHHSNR